MTGPVRAESEPENLLSGEDLDIARSKEGEDEGDDSEGSTPWRVASLVVIAAIAALLGAAGVLIHLWFGSSASHPTPLRARRRLEVVQAFEGGGFRSVVSYAGLAAGFLAILAPHEDGFSTLFDKVDIFASNSGGGWYDLSTIFSESMQAMQVRMAQKPENAGEIFNSVWVDALAVPKDSGKAVVNYFLLDAHCNWRAVSDSVMGAANITSLAPLSSDVNDFAKGKLMLACISIPTRGGSSQRGVWLGFDGVVNGSAPAQSISYTAGRKGNSTYPKFLPAKFTFWLGDGPSDSSPFPVCAADDCSQIFLEYLGVDGNMNVTASSPPVSEILDSGYMHSAGLVPITAVAAASSAMGFSIIRNPVSDECLDMAVWANSQPHGQSFSSALKQRHDLRNGSMITQSLIESTAASGLEGLLDGYFTDNIGIADALSVLTGPHAAPAGSHNLSFIAWLNDPPRFQPSNTFLFHFAGADEKQAPLGPIFSSPTYSEVVKILSSSPTLKPQPQSRTTKLEAIKYGSITGCQTMANEWFGVSGGYIVDIHFFLVSSSIDMRGKPPYTDLGDVAGDIVQVLLENAEVLRPFLEEIYLLNRTS